MSLFDQVRPDEVRLGTGPATHEKPALRAVPDAVETDAPVMLVTTQGGHLAHLLALDSWWRRYDRIWVAPPTADVADKLDGERVVTSYYPTTRNLWNAVRNFALAVR